MAIQGIWSPASLPFLDLNNTTVVLLKLYASLVAASCISAFLCFSLPGKSVSLLSFLQDELRRAFLFAIQSSYQANEPSQFLSRSTIAYARQFFIRAHGSSRIHLAHSSKRAYSNPNINASDSHFAFIQVQSHSGSSLGHSTRHPRPRFRGLVAVDRRYCCSCSEGAVDLFGCSLGCLQLPLFISSWSTFHNGHESWRRASESLD